MIDFTDFERDYFIQSRKEIDTEKAERDKLLNFAVVVLGALGFAFVESDTAKEFLQQPISLMFEVSTLVILTSLFWVRRKKLQQIADRWYTLHRMLVQHFGERRSSEMMESIVVRSFEEARYIRKDVVLNIALSLPIYTLLFVSASGLKLDNTFHLLIPFLIIIFHILVSLAALATKMQDPFPATVSEILEPTVEHIIEPDST